MKNVSRGKTCAVTLAPTHPRQKNGHILAQYSLLVGEGHERNKLERKKKLLMSTDDVKMFLSVDPTPKAIRNFMELINALDAETLSDQLAAELFHPLNINQFSPFTVANALKDRFLSTVKEVPWNQGIEIDNWRKDLRFLGQWWISLQQPDSTVMRKVVQNLDLNPLKEVYVPHLLGEDAEEEDKINQYIANLALRTQGRLFFFDLLHMDLVPLNPARMQVLWFDGFVLCALGYQKKGVYEESVSNGCSAAPSEIDSIAEASLCMDNDDVHRRQSDPSNSSSGGHSRSRSLGPSPFALQTVSLSICQIGSASLLVLFTALVSISDQLYPVKNLDLSYNLLGNPSLFIFVSLLPLTKIRRLSLRGNNLRSYDPSAITDFLLEGCYFIEELDLSITNLTAQQASALIDALPKLTRLRYLFINGVILPDNLVTALGKVINTSKNLNVSSDFCIERVKATLDGAGSNLPSEGSFQATSGAASSFFEQFYRASREKGWVPPDLGGLPRNYREFRSNDPSLHVNFY